MTLKEFLNEKTKKNANYNIDSIDTKNTSYEDIISNYDLHDEDIEIGRAIYNKEASMHQAEQNKTLGLGDIQRAQSQAQQGVQNQYSLRTKYQNYLNQQQGIDSSVAGTVASDLSLRSKMLSQMGAINSNALNNTQKVNQAYDEATRGINTIFDETTREIASRYEAQRQANYEALMVDESGAGDHLQNIQTYKTTYKYDTLKDLDVAQSDLDEAKDWLAQQKSKRTLPDDKIAELERKINAWQTEIHECRRRIPEKEKKKYYDDYLLSLR